MLNSEMPKQIEFHTNMLIENYQLVEKLGEGSFGVVWLVTDIRNKEKLALKILKLWEIPEKNQAPVLKRFRLEFEIGQQDSDFLIKNYEYGYFEGNPFFVMEYCSHGSLRNFLRSNILDSTQCERFCINILKGLQILHQGGRVHRDLRPENLLITNDHSLKLTDFGIAGHLQYQMTVLLHNDTPSEIFGNYAYMPPEQLSPKSRLETLLPTIDIFAFGVVAFELFSVGKLPFGTFENEADLPQYLINAREGKYGNLLQINNTIPQKWVSIIEKCLCSDYKNRFANIQEILNEVEEVQFETAKKTRSIKQIALKVVEGDEPNKIYTLSNFGSDILKVGRKATEWQNDLQIQESDTSFISRQHCTLEWHGTKTGWIIRDGQWAYSNDANWKTSKNGTYKNGIAVDLSGQLLANEDVLTIGNTTLKVILLND